MTLQNNRYKLINSSTISLISRKLPVRIKIRDKELTAILVEGRILSRKNKKEEKERGEMGKPSRSIHNSKFLSKLPLIIIFLRMEEQECLQMKNTKDK